HGCWAPLPARRAARPHRRGSAARSARARPRGRAVCGWSEYPSERCRGRSPVKCREAGASHAAAGPADALPSAGPTARRVRASVPLVRGLLLLDLAQPGQVELAAAGEVDHAVLLLEDVGQLRVAVAEHQRVLEQHPGQALEALIELLLAAHPLAVAPGLGGV